MILRVRNSSPVFIIGCIIALGALLFYQTSKAAELMSITQGWRYSTENLNGVNWQALNYAETGWSNASPALLYIEDSAVSGPKNTPLPQRSGGGPKLTYYFRSAFNLTNAVDVSSLMFSTLLDDGAVFYLNGIEVQRVGMPGGTISYTNLATRTIGNATLFDFFSVSGDALTNLVTGSNVIAVEVHQSAATSSDIVFGATLGYTTGTNLLRGPYLQSGSHSSLTIRWRSDAAVQGTVRYGTNLASLDLIADEPAPTSEHEVKLAGLSPDTKYFYTIGDAVTTLAGGDTNHFFITAPLPGTPKPTHIWVIGDSGTATTNQINVRNAYESAVGRRRADLWLMLGDNAYPNGTDAEHQRAVFDVFTNQLRTTVLWPTLGNHETYWMNANGNHAYFDIFTLPKNGEAGGLASGTEHYYSFDYGNIHFVCLDSMESPRTNNSAMAMWLTNDLADTTADWLIAYWHHPPYSKGTHNSDTEIELVEMRQTFLPILEVYGVDLVLCGHSHVYERSFLLDGHYGVSSNFSSAMKLNPGDGRENGNGAYVKPAEGFTGRQGAVYAVCGSSGQTSGTTFGMNHPAMFMSRTNLGSLILDINSNRLDAIFLRDTGATNDWFTILKTGNQPTFDASGLRITSVSVNGNGQPTVTWASIGGTRYRVSFSDNAADVFTDLVRHVTLETDPSPFGAPSSQSFTDNFTLTGGSPINGARYYRVRVVP